MSPTRRAACLLLLLCLATAPTASAFEVGDVAPDFTLDDLITRDPFGMQQYRGQVVVINFWAYW